MNPFDYRPRTRILFGAGEFSRLGEVARELGGTRCLVVADPGMVDAGYVRDATRSLKARRMDVYAFHDFSAAPTMDMVTAGVAYAAPNSIDLVVGLGGGSSLDCAKAINLVLSNGGSIADYRGYGKAQKPLLPMIAVPTTAGTGSESQSDVWLTDSSSKSRINIGDGKMTYRVALLDPKLTLTQKPELAVAAGFDAISHSLETLWSPKKTPISECFSREAWRLLDGNFTRCMRAPHDLEARGAVQLGSHLAGIAVEYSSLGAAHALAHALTATCGIAHGTAIALMLPHVVSWYQDAWEQEGGHSGLFLEDGLELDARLRDLAAAAELPRTLRDASVLEEVLPRLADEAAAEWAARYSARPLDSAAAFELYKAAW
ncbi:MAG: iron-containing alcohol dehydrogenase [Bryobacteraceae bacterium]